MDRWSGRVQGIQTFSSSDWVFYEREWETVQSDKEVDKKIERDKSS